MVSDANTEGPHADVALMLRTKGGDRDAYAAIYRRYYTSIQHFFYALGSDSATAEDLCQEVFLRVWRLRTRYRASGSFRAYLFAIARHVWLEHVRKSATRARFSAPPSFDMAQVQADDRTRPDESCERSELEARLMSAVQRLPEDQRMAFVLRVAHGLTLREVATAMNCPVNTVRSRKSLAINKLRSALRSWWATAR
jgi:RNA polymerase sigma-70 factor, ECF subfamily